MNGNAQNLKSLSLWKLIKIAQKNISLWGLSQASMEGGKEHLSGTHAMAYWGEYAV